ncbi:MAG: 50S ribosomal protein L18e [Candidatus Heimdallarchaeota archaeon]|nr:50S ribosomal protein L18e [Candidatus Heimdallarchaeota archaeon]MDH5646839.1 50S ribosomal protein L18e [Candidatus Heimdallarchaeota archaeon]
MVNRDKGPTNPLVASLIVELRKASTNNQAAIWRTIFKILQKPRRQRTEVNLSKINRYTKENEQVIVPGKVLGTGELNHSVVVAAIAFSQSAKDKITAANGRAITISNLVEENPKGSGIRIIR